MIALLDEQTVGQIAAGEVIERPLSVVKELVENAVDAGASRIGVWLNEGGFELIEVADNGCGIRADELRLALARHATSKLVQASDLQSVSTLGFRGEGLASIAAVSSLRLTSRVAGHDIGASVQAHREQVGHIEPIAAPLGTCVSARDLFANIPVRREYMRSPASEFARVSAWLSTFALAYPQIAFSLSHGGKSTWTIPAGNDPTERLCAVFGKGARDSLIALNTDASAGLRGALSGFISKPGNDRPDRRMQLLFINGRLLRSPVVAGAWTAAYSTFAMTGRHPFGVLFVSLPPEHVDPNVHPTKSDVRLRFTHQVVGAVKASIARTLHMNATQRFHEALSFAPSSIVPSLSNRRSFLDDTEPAPQTDERPKLRVFGQVDASFIIAADDAAVMLVDQHAAHERIAYEKIMQRAEEHAPAEALLVPLMIELDRAQSERLARVLDTLREGGLDIEQFGEGSYRIRATPAGYASRPFDIVGFLDDFSGQPRALDARERVWASLACHSVVRAGETLAHDEMVSLIQRLQHCRNPMHCPHGRPTIVRLGAQEIARLFKRL
ncbi:MAG: DNA mismatch repair endonuclease MutL [Candidatus Eremiobacteraeota bacterium]|nr:DNA mismatch repair endonuclease MutL [Candidatus Eremiobacteraeota bacterium]